MKTNLQSKLPTQKPGQIESLIDDLEISTKGSEDVTNSRQVKKMKSTSSLPESQASSKIVKPKKPQQWLQDMFSKLDNLNKNGYQGCTEKWNSLGAVDSDDWIETGKVEFDPNFRIMVVLNDYGYDKYYGQVNSKGQYHGLGRLVKISGQIYEGSFSDGQKSGYGREIEFHHTYTGIFDDGSKFDDKSIKYHQVDENKWFDQTKLRAALKMRSDLKADIMNRMDAVKKKSRHGQKRQPKKEVKKEEEKKEEELKIEADLVEKQKAVNPEEQEEDMSQDDALLQVVDSLWDQYDDDGNGYLDLDETRNFIQEIMQQVPNAQDFDEDAFQELFHEFDEDKSGTIEKPELVNFLKKLVLE